MRLSAPGMRELTPNGTKHRGKVKKNDRERKAYQKKKSVDVCHTNISDSKR